jgi:hypothetical protein
MTFMGGVLVMLALLAGFVAPAPNPPGHVARLARGPLIEAAEHPEWKQLLVQAAYRRADELERLRNMPDEPEIVLVKPAIIEAASAPEQLASLPATPAESELNDVTGSIDETPSMTIPVEIGEASSIELPLREQDLQPPVQVPATLKRPNQSQRKLPARPRIKNAKVRTKPPVQPPPMQDFFSALFSTPRAN